MTSLVIVVSAVLVLTCGKTHRQTRMNAILPRLVGVSNFQEAYLQGNKNAHDRSTDSSQDSRTFGGTESSTCTSNSKNHPTFRENNIK